MIGFTESGDKGERIQQRPDRELYTVIREVLGLGEDGPTMDIDATEQELNECLLLMAAELDFILEQEHSYAA